MNNFWLNSIDKALLYLGYDKALVDLLTNEEKKSIIIDEYLFKISNNNDDIGSLSLDDMADYIIDCQRNK